MRRRDRSARQQLLAASIVSLVLLSLAAVPASAATVRMVDDDGRASAGNCAGTAAVPRKIQSAINAAAAGDTVLVCPGSYPGELNIGAAKSGLVLRSATALGATISGLPSRTTGSIVTIGAHNARLLGFRISAPAPSSGSCTNYPNAVLVRDAKGVQLRGNHIAPAGTATLGPCGYGTGVRLTGASTGTARTAGATVTDNQITDFKYYGILAAGAVHLVANDNTITYGHAGQTPAFGAHGMGLTGRASGTLRGNSIAGGPSAARLVTGILLTNTHPSVLLEGNTVSGTRTAFSLAAAHFAILRDNSLSGTGDGLVLSATTDATVERSSASQVGKVGLLVTDSSRRNSITDNTISDAGVLGCQDTTTGTRTGGTANTWTGNSAPSSAPAAICNSAPVVTTSSGSLSYTEGDPATAVDPALTVSDANDTQLSGARVRLASGFESGDALVFSDQSGITGSYDSGTGVLTLSGTASVSDYQSALRQVAFRHSGDHPATSRTVAFRASDALGHGAEAGKAISVTRVNDAPLLATTNSALSYSEGDGQKAVDPGLTVSDVDSTNLAGATVQITGNFAAAEDELSFADTSSITGSYNDSTGTLTLSGSATRSAYQSALRQVKYENSSQSPSTATRTVSFQADDGASANNVSNVATRDITVGVANDLPVVTTSAGSLAYSEGDPAIAIDPNLTVSDADDTNLAGARVRISSGFEAGDDVLAFADQPGITGSWDSATGVLTLSGNASVADYQTALRSVTFRHTGDHPTTTARTVAFRASDNNGPGAEATRNISLTRVNDAPTLDTTDTALSYREGDGQVAIDPGITVSDPDSTNLASATVQITSNFSSAEDELAFTTQSGISGSYDDSTGTLTLTGSASKAAYQTALRSVKYENSGSPPTTTTRTVSFQVDDGAAADNLSAVATRDISVVPPNAAPVLTPSSGSTSYTEGGSAATVDGALTVSDSDDTNLESGRVSITSGFQAGDVLSFATQNGITGSYNSGTGVLTLAGSASLADYQAALRSITFSSTNDAPVSSKTVEFRVSDGDDNSATPTKEITVTATNDAPTVTTSAGNTGYTEGDAATVIDASLTVTDPDDTTLDSGQVRIKTGFQAGDTLRFTDQLGISGSYDASTGVLTLSGSASVADWQTALRAVKFESTNDGLSSSKTVEFKLNDGEADSNLPTKTIATSGVNDPPGATNLSAAETYTEDTPLNLTDIVVSDPDGDNLTVTLTLSAPATGGLSVATSGSTTSTYDPATGVWSASGPISELNALLAGVTFNPAANHNANLSIATSVSDGAAPALTGSKALTGTPVNDPPGATNLSAAETYTEDTPLNLVDIVTSDVDSGNLTVTLTLSIPAAGGLSTATSGSTTSTYDPATGVWSASGPISEVNALLAGVNFNPASNFNASFSIATSVSDGVAAAVTGSKAMTGSAVNDAPTNTAPSAQTVAEDTDLVFSSANGNALSVSDVDATSLQVTLTAANGTATLSTTSGLTVTGNGTATVVASGSIANLNAALDGVKYRGAAHFNSTRGTASLQLATSDQGATGSGGTLSDTDSVAITLDAVADAPVASAQSFSIQTNMQRTITVALSGAAGPTDPDTGDAGYTPSFSLTSVSLPGSGCSGCTLSSIDLAAGTFAFDPPPGQTGSFSVNYTVSDSGTPGGGQTSAPGTLTMNVSGPVIWFVAPSSGNDTTGRGTLAAPFATLGKAGSVDAPNHSVFVYSGGSSASGITLASGEWLIGQAANPGQTFDQFFAINPPTGTVARPSFNSGTSTSAGTITLASNTRVRGLTISTGTASGLVGSGGLTGVTVSESSVATTTGTALDLNNAVGSYTLSSVSTNGAANGVLLEALGATNVTITAGSIVGATARGVDINGGTGSFSYGGSITTSSTGRSVEVTGHTGGNVTFSGTINDAGLGINLGSGGPNTGATFSFDNTLTLSTGPNAAFTAVGPGPAANSGGTVTVTGSGNTLSTTTGTALTVQHTTIGAGGLTFRSISANGAANGIVLDNPGTSGALTVTGDGSTVRNNSGGTIQNIIGDNGAVPGNGIYLNNTRGVSLSHMQLNGFQNSAVRGIAVHDFTFAHSTINGTTGDADNQVEAPLSFGAPTGSSMPPTSNGLTGTALITNSSISGGRNDNVSINDQSGTLVLTVTGTAIGPNSTAFGNHGISILAQSSSNSPNITLNVSNSTFTSNKGMAIAVNIGGSSSANVDVGTSTFQSNGFAVALATNHNADLVYDIHDNPAILRSGSNAIQVLAAVGSTTSSRVSGKIRNNFIGDNTVESGSQTAYGIALEGNSSPDFIASVTGNTIKHTDQNGIFMQFRDETNLPGAGLADVTIRNNSIGTIDDNTQFPFFHLYGVHVHMRYDFVGCLDMAGNVSSHVGSEAADFKVDQSDSSTFKLERFTGSGTNATAVANHVKAENPYSGVTAEATFETTFTGAANGTCRDP